MRWHSECKSQDVKSINILKTARIMRVDNRKGSLAAGKDADIIIFDEDIQVKMTMVNGKVVHRI